MFYRMIHLDYRYPPRLILTMVVLVGSGLYLCMLGPPILGGGTFRGGMPLYKYFANRALTLIENLVLGVKLSEYHTGCCAFSYELLESLPLATNSDDFTFDSELLVQVLWRRLPDRRRITCPTKYFSEASSTNFCSPCATARVAPLRRCDSEWLGSVGHVRLFPAIDS